jgi:predicted protein tyrosine phosphatase
MTLKNKEISFHSKAEIEIISEHLKEPHIIISIFSDSEEYRAKFKENKNRLGLLFLEFYDIARKVIHLKLGELNPISDKQAKEIVDFVHKFKEVERILVNCEAGVSRSAGVVLALEQILNNRDLRYSSDFNCANHYVRNKIMKAYKENYELSY